MHQFHAGLVAVSSGCNQDIVKSTHSGLLPHYVVNYDINIYRKCTDSSSTLLNLLTRPTYPLSNRTFIPCG